MCLSSTVRRTAGRPDALHSPPGDVVCFGDRLRCVCRLLYDGSGRPVRPAVVGGRPDALHAPPGDVVTGDGVSVVYCTTGGWST